MNMKALVTGGAGFIGSTLVDRLLRDGWSVDVIDNLSTGKLANLANARASFQGNVRFHRFDIRSSELIGVIEKAAPDVIFHLAAQVDVRISVNDPLLGAQINVIGLLHVLEGARGRDEEGRVLDIGRHDLRRARAIPNRREPTAAPHLAIRREQEGSKRLPRLLPRTSRLGIHRACLRECVWSTSGPARRSRGCRDFCRAPLERRSDHDFR